MTGCPGDDIHQTFDCTILGPLPRVPSLERHLGDSPNTKMADFFDRHVFLSPSYLCDFERSELFGLFARRSVFVKWNASFVIPREKNIFQVSKALSVLFVLCWFLYL